MAAQLQGARGLDGVKGPEGMGWDEDEDEDEDGELDMDEIEAEMRAMGWNVEDGDVDINGSNGLNGLDGLGDGGMGGMGGDESEALLVKIMRETEAAGATWIGQ